MLLSNLFSGTGIAQSVQKLAKGWTAERSEIDPGRLKNSVFLHVVQTGSVVHPTSYPMGTGGPFPEDKATVA
jgi:hypothetical protein